MDGLPPRTHNNPPDAIDDICAAYEATRLEAENWLDGVAVESEAQMKAVDAIRASARDWRLALERGQKAESGPLYDAYKAALERWKPTIEDAKRIEAGLVAVVDGFKRKLAAEKAEAERKAREEARAKAAEAERLAREADAANIEASRAAAEAAQEAQRAEEAARAAANDKVKGLRTVWHHEVTDHRAALHDIARNDKDAITRFVEEYARAHYRQRPIEGVKVWSEKEAF
jgi:hypothetical protein